MSFNCSVLVQGLKPSRHYYYRFSSGKLVSPVGRTKTTADGPLEEMLFALVSCSNWGWGYFHVYDLVSKVDNLDLVVHCGGWPIIHLLGRLVRMRAVQRWGRGQQRERVLSCVGASLELRLAGRFPITGAR